MPRSELSPKQFDLLRVCARRAAFVSISHARVGARFIVPARVVSAKPGSMNRAPTGCRDARRSGHFNARVRAQFIVPLEVIHKAGFDGSDLRFLSKAHEQRARCDVVPGATVAVDEDTRESRVRGAASRRERHGETALYSPQDNLAVRPRHHDAQTPRNACRPSPSPRSHETMKYVAVTSNTRPCTINLSTRRCTSSAPPLSATASPAATNHKCQERQGVGRPPRTRADARCAGAADAGVAGVVRCIHARVFRLG